MAIVTITKDVIRKEEAAFKEGAKKNMKPEFDLILAHRNASRWDAMPKNVGDSPFKLTVDPELRTRLRQALVELINDHENTLAHYVADKKLHIDSYKEYIELFAKSLKETMNSDEGVSYLLRYAGFELPPSEGVNLNPDWRWGANGHQRDDAGEN